MLHVRIVRFDVMDTVAFFLNFFLTKHRLCPCAQVADNSFATCAHTNLPALLNYYASGISVPETLAMGGQRSYTSSPPAATATATAMAWAQEPSHDGPAESEARRRCSSFKEVRCTVTGKWRGEKRKAIN